MQFDMKEAQPRVQLVVKKEMKKIYVAEEIFLNAGREEQIELCRFYSLLKPFKVPVAKCIKVKCIKVNSS